MRNINLNFLILCLVVGGAALVKGRANFIDRQPGAVSMALPVVVTNVLNNKAVGPSKPHLKLENRDLRFYQTLKGKAQVSAIEDAKRLRLLNDPDVLRGLKPHLLHEVETPEQARERSAAIDMLREALRTGDREVAREVLGWATIDEDALKLSESDDLAVGDTSASLGH